MRTIAVCLCLIPALVRAAVTISGHLNISQTLSPDSSVLLDNGLAGRALVRRDGSFSLSVEERASPAPLADLCTISPTSAQGEHVLSVADRDFSFPSVSARIMADMYTADRPVAAVRVHSRRYGRSKTIYDWTCPARSVISTAAALPHHFTATGPQRILRQRKTVQYRRSDPAEQDDFVHGCSCRLCHGHAQALGRCVSLHGLLLLTSHCRK